MVEAVPLNIKDRIFEPFLTTKPPGQGIALGLGITKKITEEHNGRIELEMEEGERSTFTVILSIIDEKREGN
jgi:signal transduction histidine kinase